MNVSGGAWISWHVLQTRVTYRHVPIRERSCHVFFSYVLSDGFLLSLNRAKQFIERRRQEIDRVLLFLIAGNRHEERYQHITNIWRIIAVQVKKIFRFPIGHAPRFYICRRKQHLPLCSRTSGRLRRLVLFASCGRFLPQYIILKTVFPMLHIPFFWNCPFRAIAIKHRRRHPSV